MVAIAALPSFLAGLLLSLSYTESGHIPGTRGEKDCVDEHPDCLMLMDPELNPICEVAWQTCPKTCNQCSSPQARDDDSEPYWCSNLDEVQCELNPEAKSKYCIKHCKDAIMSLQDFLRKFDKSYGSKEEAEKRQAIFSENVKKINKHNKLYEEGKSTYKMGVNEFTDLTHEEFLNRYTGLDSTLLKKRFTGYAIYYEPQDIGEEPDHLDYRERGALNPIRNQGYTCKSCWAFTAVAAIESGLFLKRGKLTQLSEQNLVDCCDDCSVGDPCEGRGGSYLQAFDEIIEEGIAFQDDYEYTAVSTGTCKQAQKIFPILKYEIIKKYNESHLLNALVKRGPIAVSLETTDSFQHYKGGIYKEDHCTSKKLDHGVVLIGYGTEDGTNYWIIRNSWGEDWGEKGYMRMERNVANDCGIKMYPAVPTIAS